MNTADVSAMFSDELISSLCKSLFDYTSLYWLRDALLCEGGFGKIMRVYMQYPGLWVKKLLKSLHETAEECAISICNRGLGVSFYDAEYTKPIVEVSYPEGAVLSLAREGAVYKANIFGLKVNLSESLLFLQSLFSVLLKRLSFL